MICDTNSETMSVHGIPGREANGGKVITCTDERVFWFSTAGMKKGADLYGCFLASKEPRKENAHCHPHQVSKIWSKVENAKRTNNYARRIIEVLSEWMVIKPLIMRLSVRSKD